jgi:hypothetical protein
MKFGHRQSPEPEPEPVPVPAPSYDPASSSASSPGHPQGTPFGQSAGSPPAAADAMPPGFPPAAPDAMPPGFAPAAAGAMPAGFPMAGPDAMPPGFPPAGALPPGFPVAGPGAMPPGFPAAYGGDMPAGFPGAPGFPGVPGVPSVPSLPQFTAAMQNPRVLDALVRSGKFRNHEEAQAWVSQMVARATQSAGQQAALGGMQPRRSATGGAATDPPSLIPGHCAGKTSAERCPAERRIPETVSERCPAESRPARAQRVWGSPGDSRRVRRPDAANRCRAVRGRQGGCLTGGAGPAGVLTLSACPVIM